jgi:hypothetical protein
MKTVIKLKTTLLIDVLVSRGNSSRAILYIKYVFVYDVFYITRFVWKVDKDKIKYHLDGGHLCASPETMVHGGGLGI